jgi:acetoin utilization protein AcuB
MNIQLRNHISESLITVATTEVIERALKIMQSHNFRHLPVIDETKKIVGLVSDRDLYRGLSEQKHHILDVMTTTLKTIDINDDIEAVVQKMIHYKISAIPVTREKEIIGLITTEDLMFLLLKFLSENDDGPTLLADFVGSFKGLSDSFKYPNYIA